MSVAVTAVYLDAAGLRCGRADEVRALVDEPRRADCMVRTLAAPPRSWPT